MKPFKFLNLVDHQIISNKLYDYIVNDTSVLDSKVTWNELNYKKVLKSIPELKAVADSFNLEISMIAVVKLTASGILHVDYAGDVRFLWPVHNCRGSKTVFYNLNDSKLQKKLGVNNLPYIEISNPELCTVSDELELTEPIVFDSGIPHKVFINEENTDIRLSATIGFKCQPLSLL
jgi:hypothetical protein